MRKVSVRLDDARAAQLDKIYSYYGFTSDVESDNIKAIVDMLHKLTLNHINSQTVTAKMGEHETAIVNIDCSLRITTQKLVRALDNEGEPCWENQNVNYCVQWERGRVKRQLKLESTETCEICSLLKANWLSEQEDLNEPERPEMAPAIRQPLTVTIPQSQSTPAKPQEVPNSFDCDKKRCKVHYAVCFECRAKDYLMYKGCILANPQIAIALAYWKTLGNKK